jgi:hypothetical protein
VVGVELAKQMGRWTAHRMSPDAMAEAFIVRTMKAVAVVRWRIRRKPSSIGIGTLRHRIVRGFLYIFRFTIACIVARLL